MKKYKIGYTQGTFDLFHVGHLNLLCSAKNQCEYLIVGVNSNELVTKYKNKEPTINEIDRLKIVEAIKFVDEAFIVGTLDKLEIYKKIDFDVVFIGDDWKGSDRWNNDERLLAEVGVKVEYIPYTKNVSTTFIRRKIDG